MSRTQEFHRGRNMSVAYGKVSSGQLTNYSHHHALGTIHGMEMDRHSNMSAEAIEDDQADMMMRHAGRAADHDIAEGESFRKADKAMSVYRSPRKMRMDEFNYASNHMNATWQ